MPSDPLEILPLADAKNALRIDGTDSDSDLTASIAAAVDYCQRLTWRSFLDVAEDLYVPRPGLSDKPMCIPRRDVKTIDSIVYWETDQELREMPGGTVPVSGEDEGEIGRIQPYGYDTLVWPPEDGWPEILTGSDFRVSLTTGYADADDIPGIAGIRKAVAVMTATYFDGIVEDTHRRAVLDLLRPYQDARGLV